MKKFIKIIFWASVLLALAAMAICGLGRVYEISRLPADFPEKEVAGLEWEFVGIYLFVVALMVGLMASVLWLIESADKGNGRI